MNIIEVIWPYFQEILPYVVTLLVSILSYLIFALNNKQDKEKIKSLEEQLEHAKSAETYIKCPKCGAKLPLSDVTFYLPGDVKDNNLNGIDDNLEN